MNDVRALPHPRLSDDPSADEIIDEFIRVMVHGTPLNWKRWKDVMEKAQRYRDRAENEKKKRK